MLAFTADQLMSLFKHLLKKKTAFVWVSVVQEKFQNHTLSLINILILVYPTF